MLSCRHCHRMLCNCCHSTKLSNKFIANSRNPGRSGFFEYWNRQTDWLRDRKRGKEPLFISFDSWFEIQWNFSFDLIRNWVNILQVLFVFVKFAIIDANSLLPINYHPPWSYICLPGGVSSYLHGSSMQAITHLHKIFCLVYAAMKELILLTCYSCLPSPNVC